MKKPEIILGALVAVALTMNYLKLPFGGALSVLSISGLAVYYYPIFPLTVTGNSLKTLFSRAKSKKALLYAFLTGIGLSTLLMGLLFKIQLWPMASTLLSVGLFSVLVMMAVNAIQFKKTGKELFKMLLVRSLVGFFVGSVAYMISEDFLLEHHFGDHPSYIDAYKNWEANPSNPEAVKRLEGERLKLYVISDQRDSLR